MELKEKVKEGWKKAKAWVVDHKKEIVIGSVITVFGSIAAFLLVGKKDSHEEEGEEILAVLQAAQELDEEEDEPFKERDRYTIDKSVMELLPPGTYDVFDGYENQRVDYVVESKEPTEM